jgi:hypothetical protein
MKRNPSRYLRRQKDLHAPKPSSFAKYSGVTTRKRKPLGNVKIPFEKNTHTYLLAFPKLEGELHLKGVSLSRPSFSQIKNFIMHSWHIAFQIFSKVLNFILQRILSNAPFSQVLDSKAFRKKVFYK